MITPELIYRTIRGDPNRPDYKYISSPEGRTRLMRHIGEGMCIKHFCSLPLAEITEDESWIRFAFEVLATPEVLNHQRDMFLLAEKIKALLHEMEFSHKERLIHLSEQIKNLPTSLENMRYQTPPVNLSRNGVEESRTVKKVRSKEIKKLEEEFRSLAAPYDYRNQTVYRLIDLLDQRPAMVSILVNPDFFPRVFTGAIWRQVSDAVMESKLFDE